MTMTKFKAHILQPVGTGATDLDIRPGASLTLDDGREFRVIQDIGYGTNGTPDISLLVEPVVAVKNRPGRPTKVHKIASFNAEGALRQGELDIMETVETARKIEIAMRLLRHAMEDIHAMGERGNESQRRSARTYVAQLRDMAEPGATLSGMVSLVRTLDTATKEKI